MNAQDIRNLQEAYMNVYEQVVPDPTNSRSIGTPRVNPDSMKQYGEFKNLPAWRMKNLIKDINYGQQVKGPEKKITTQVAHLDLFDLIRGHLLDEGYAETAEAAEVIMVNMSEEWISTILEVHSVDAERLLMHKYKNTGEPYRQRQYLKSKPRKRTVGN